MQPIIMHIDMNSYFASCEQQDNPAWRGLPLGVCEHLGGIIIAPSVEAKRFGIKTGTLVWEAKKLYPKIILTHTHPDRYRHYTAGFLKIFADYTDQIDKYSIDEAFLDVTKVCNVKKYQKSNIKNQKYECKDADPFEEASRIAREIKRRITAEVGDWLRCSVGIASNKLVAKIASDMQKPDGLVVVSENQNLKIKMQNLGVFSLTKNDLYYRLKLTDIPGIAARQAANLNALGIKTLLDLKNYPLEGLVARFGIMGYHLHSMGQLEGSFQESFEEDLPIKSMGHAYTIPVEHRKPQVTQPVLYKLCEMVAARLRANSLEGFGVSAHIHAASGESFGKSKRIGQPISDGREIFLEAWSLIKSLASAEELARLAPKFVAVTVFNLAPAGRSQSLFGWAEKQHRLAAALDNLNAKYGDFTITRLPAFLAREIIRDSIGFGRMKEFRTSGKFRAG